MEKALMTASVASMLDNFNCNNIKLLQERGYEVTLAANFDAAEDSSPLPKLQRFREEMEAQGCRVVHIDFSRKILNLPKQLLSYCQLKTLAKENFALVHCNSPICAAMTRIVFRKKRRGGTRLIYTAHGFHFFRGAPVKNWLIFFPVEWICAHWTDIINTINQEDYHLAKKWLHARQIVRLPGVGINLERFRPGNANREAVRRKLGIGQNEKMLLSVGELSRRKNQGNVIKALKLIENNDLRYVICGLGKAEKRWKILAERLGLSDRILFIGYREDIPELCQAADIFVFPSLQEGLPMALMEAIAVKVPVICSDVRGNRELVPEKELRFNPIDAQEIANCIIKVLNTDMDSYVEAHYKRIKTFSSEQVILKMKEEY